ncbi:mitochondrial f0 subunit e [Apiospora aurea]|uniref:ATP synthase F(0) complex subunit e, mitochondrial n=1 Tax=Apiospora aurea TaxID=335848 RepID=A0ABR1QBW2_9PEZI
MSASSGVNVLRYSALAFGVFYGFTHQRSITASQKAAAAQKEWAHKQHLIDQARAQYAESKNPKASSTDKSPRMCLPFLFLSKAKEMLTPADTVKQDPMDPKFDLEAYLTALDKQGA